MEYEDSVPMDRRPTLPVADILGADRQERSWESARQELDGWAPLRPTGAKESVTSAWRVCTSAHPYTFREAEGQTSQAAPAHRWSEVQGSFCPALIRVVPQGWTIGGGSS